MQLTAQICACESVGELCALIEHRSLEFNHVPPCQRRDCLPEAAARVEKYTRFSSTGGRDAGAESDADHGGVPQGIAKRMFSA